MARIKFRAEVNLDDEIEKGFDTDYYMWELEAEDVSVSIPHVIYADLDFTVDFDEEEISEEDMWFKICGEFGRPQRIDGGSEF